MSASAPQPAPPALASPGSSRPVEEIVVAAFFGPLANLLVRLLAPTPVTPPSLVLAHGLMGLAAAVLLGVEGVVAAAVLLQACTLLDNMDGRLARVTGRVSLTGRYLDTVVDFVANAALFVALSLVTGEPLLALVSFAALVVVLSVDFNVSGLFAEVNGRAAPEPLPIRSRTEGLLEGAYGAVFAPQDRATRRFVTRRLERLLAGERDSVRIREATLAYHDRVSVSVLANLGLSTQLVVLGLCLVAGVPEAYLWLVVASLALLPLLQLRRERRARRALVR